MSSMVYLDKKANGTAVEEGAILSGVVAAGNPAKVVRDIAPESLQYGRCIDAVNMKIRRSFLDIL